jgi:prevent-host-death family protein
MRKRFGQLLDEAAAGERLIIARAGQPIAALVPLSDVPEVSREERIRRRREAVADIARMAHRNPGPKVDGAALIKEQRRLRLEQIMRNVHKARK